MRLSFITQFKVEFSLQFTSCGKVLGKMPVEGGTYVTQTGSNKGGQSKITNFKQTYFLNASYISCTVVVFCYYCTWTQFQFWFQST